MEIISLTLKAIGALPARLRLRLPDWTRKLRYFVVRATTMIVMVIAIMDSEVNSFSFSGNYAIETNRLWYGEISKENCDSIEEVQFLILLQHVYKAYPFLLGRVRRDLKSHLCFSLLPNLPTCSPSRDLFSPFEQLPAFSSSAVLLSATNTIRQILKCLEVENEEAFSLVVD